MLLLPLPSVNVYGAAVSETMCYLFAAICVIIYLKIKVGLKMQASSVLKPLAAGLLMTLFITAALASAPNVFGTSAGTLALIALSAAVYAAALSLLKTFDRQELDLLPVKNRKVNTYDNGSGNGAQG